jgi:hypothetical protein
LSDEKSIEIGASDSAVQALTWSLHSSESNTSTYIKIAPVKVDEVVAIGVAVSRAHLWVGEQNTRLGVVHDVVRNALNSWSTITCILDVLRVVVVDVDDVDARASLRKRLGS